MFGALFSIQSQAIGSAQVSRNTMLGLVEKAMSELSPLSVWILRKISCATTVSVAFTGLNIYVSLACK